MYVKPGQGHFAISNGNVEDPVVLERLIRGFDFPRSEADDQDPVSLRHEFGGRWGCNFHFGNALSGKRLSKSVADLAKADNCVAHDDYPILRSD
jgi:hypothetical protein